MPGIKIADITTNETLDSGIGNALIPMSLNGNSFSTSVNDFFYANVITAVQLAADSINANHITTGTIIAKHLAGNSVTADAIAANSVTAIQISASTIDAIKISAAQINVNTIVAQVLNSLVINTDNLAANSVTADIVKTNSLIARHVKSDSIDTNHLRAGSVVAETILSRTITSDQIAVTTIAATNMASGAIEARALASNIIMTGSLQSKNFDGFVRNASTDGQDILGYLDTGEKGFFMDEQNGLIVCTDLIARNNIITSNLINFSLTASSLEEVTGDDGGKSIQVALDSNTLARDPDTGKITISNKLVNTEGFFDSSLLLNPNTIFFGMSERQEFKLPTQGAARKPIAIFVGEGNGNTNAALLDNKYNVGLSATYVNYPNLWNSTTDGIYVYRDCDKVGSPVQDGSVSRGAGDVVVYHPDDNRIHNLPFLGNEIARSTLTPMQDDTLFDQDYLRTANYNAVEGQPCIFTLDLLNYTGDSVDNISGNIQLNNLKIKVDTGPLNHINDVTSYRWFDVQTTFCSDSATGADQYTKQTSTGPRNSVQNPTILRDIYEYTLDLSLGSIDTGNLTRYALVRMSHSITSFTPKYEYPSYVTLSAVFDTDTNLRFDVTGVVPATTRYDLSTVNCLIPQNYHPDNKDEAYVNPTQQRILVSRTPTAREGNRMVWEHNWLSDTPHMEGFPEIDPNRILPNGLRGYDSPAASMQYYDVPGGGNPGLTSIITDRTINDQGLSAQGVAGIDL